jgi:cardiolipin synthase
MNVPNSLTILRIVLIPIFIGLLVYEQYQYSLAVLILAGLTDSLDGIIARVTDQRTQLGEFLDPLADKLLLSSGFITLAILHLIPSWVAIVVVSRDLILLTGTLLAQVAQIPIEIAPSWIGKGTTAFQLVYVVLIIFLSSRQIDLQYLDPLLFVMVGFTLASGFHYLFRGVARLGPSKS